MNRVQAEGILIRRCGQFMVLANMTGTAGSHVYLADAEGWALRTMGFSTASPDTVTDTDLAQLTDVHTDAFLDLAELRTLETTLQNYLMVDYTLGPMEERVGQLATRIAAMLPDKRESVSSMHGQYITKPLFGDAQKQAVFKVL